MMLRLLVIRYFRALSRLCRRRPHGLHVGFDYLCIAGVARFFHQFTHALLCLRIREK